MSELMVGADDPYLQDRELSYELMHRGERRLNAQLQSDIANDQRSTTVASLAITLATALFTVVVPWAVTEGHVPYVWGAAISGGLFSVASFCCVWAARAKDFRMSGGTTSAWVDNPGFFERAPETIYQRQANLHEGWITHNRTVMRNRRNWFTAGLAIAVVAPFLGVLTSLLI